MSSTNDELRFSRRFVAVLFTDIEDSTGYFSRAGDVAGRLRVRTHDDLLHPIVAEHAGTLVAHTGDGMLASFDDPSECCRSAIAMQQTIEQHGQEIERDARMRIRIAAHAGVGVQDEGNLFGTVVNAAARIEAVAEADQILVSGAMYAHLDPDLRKRCSFVQERELRGTGQVHRLYEVTWRSQTPRAGDGYLLQGSRPAAVAARRTVAMYVEAESSTARHGDDGADDALPSTYGEIVRAAVNRHGGRLARSSGGSAAAVFDDVVSAVDAAFAIQRRAARTQTVVEASEPPALSVRIGLHAVDLDEHAGDAIERAARLSSAAHGGQVLITEGAAGDTAAHVPEPIAIRSYGSRVLQDGRVMERILELLAPDLPVPAPVLLTAPADATPVRVLDARSAPTAGAATLADIAAAMRGEREPVVLADEDARRVGRVPPKDLSEYMASRVLEWSQPRYRLDARFVSLAMLVDAGEDAERDRWTESDHVVEAVHDLLAVPDAPAVVVLGAPGSGKSTILRRLELEIATDSLRTDDMRVPFFVPLNQYRAGTDAPTDPRAWLHGLWARRFPDLPPLATFEQDGTICYLLDGLNEMPTAGTVRFRDAVRQWKAFVERTVQRAPGNRVIFTCRSLDYSASLSSVTLRVPQVHVEPLSDQRVRQYLKLHAPVLWGEIWAAISGTSQLEVFRSPFFLRLLVNEVADHRAVPNGPAALFTGFVRRALERELERDNPLFDDERLLTARDRRSVVSGRWPSGHALPNRGCLIPLLEHLAYEMQSRSNDDDVAHVRITLDAALDILDDPQAEVVLEAGAALGILEESAAEEVMYTHQLVQEYFAARRLATVRDFRLLSQSWRQGEIDPPLRDALAALNRSERLPPLPSTGWEETVRMAAAMAPDADAFVRAVAVVHLTLAGRCATRAEVQDRLSHDVVEELRHALDDRSRMPIADLRHRIDAGLTLGALGGPRFDRRIGPLGEYLLPPMVEIASGAYVIGAEEPYEYRGKLHDEELPPCAVRLASFALGRYAVTNAEWAYFIAGRGYEDDRFWEGEPARAWRRGVGTTIQVSNLARYWRARFLAEPHLIEVELEGDRMDDATYELWHRRLRMTDDEFERHLAMQFPEAHLRAPRYWTDPRYNNPMQPVIGISCFEARAYATWLAEQSGMPFRLPNEAEWEAAARGPERRRFAYGDDFDPLRGNTMETHVGAPTPVGVFPDGDTPSGIADLTGNTYDLTSSLWGEDPIVTDWRYPYDPDDGRERADAPITVSRVGRGGAWYLGEVHARASYRGRDRFDLRPDEWLNYRGCRLARS